MERTTEAIRRRPIRMRPLVALGSAGATTTEAAAGVATGAVEAEVATAGVELPETLPSPMSRPTPPKRPVSRG